MILTVTPDPVLDNIFFIDEWLPSSVMHAQKTVFSVGGKGLDASVALSHLEQPNTALCFLAGETGLSLSQLLKKYNILNNPVWVSGETRRATIISERTHQRHTHLFSGGISVSADHLQEFLSKFHQELKHTQWVITGGIFPASLPVDFFTQLIRSSEQAGSRILIDSHSQYIQPALAETFTILKMNWKEFEWTFETQASSMDMLISQAAQIYNSHQFQALVITCGAQGILAFSPDGIYHSIPPTLEIVNAAGAGDAASAALVWQLAKGESWADALRWATAVSAAVVLTEGTADLKYEDAMQILPEVTLDVL